MPAAFREHIPPFRISMYAYSKAPEERFVIIDMKKYRAGDRVLGGALLLEIQPDNLILELDGDRFRIPRT
jgi:general secretion pathway protein B